MSVQSIFRRALQVLSGFSRADHGNVAMIFAVACVPIISFVGAAVDYSRTNAARTAMQSALDGASLMVSKDIAAGALDAQGVTARATTYFNALYNPRGAQGISISATYTPASSSNMGSSVVVTGSGSLPTQFMKVAGYPSINFGTAATTTWGNSRMRVAMVLDVTGSMASDDKMSNMQKAATDMITALGKLSKVSGDILISVIPFAKDVNPGGGLTTRDWVNWSEWEAEPPVLDTAKTGAKPSDWADIGPGDDCPFSSTTHGFTCTNRPATISGAGNASSIPSSGNYAGYICPSIDSGRKIDSRTSVYYNGCYTSVAKTTTVTSSQCSSYAHCSCTGSGSNKVCTRTTYDHVWRATGTLAAPDHGTWNGCVNDRDQDYDIANTAPQLGVPATQFYAEQWSACPDPLMPMSDQWTTLKNKINAMSPGGNTNQGIGLAWGWLSLTNAAPMQAPVKESGYAYDDYIVLVSDGLNTQNRWYTNASDIDARQKLLCAKLKAAPYNVKIFTVQINTDSRNPDPTSVVLQQCASDGNFQIITSASQTASAFEKITTQLSRLRIAK